MQKRKREAAGSAAKLIQAAGLGLEGPVTWGGPVPSAVPGIYVIETPALLEEAPLDDEAIARWIRCANG
jgi:hypothetical protein